MERRFNDQLREHEDNEFAHSSMRHMWISDSLAPQVLKLDLDRQQLQARVMRLEEKSDQEAIDRAGLAGEARATRRILRYWGAAIVTLVTAFGGAILIRVWS